MSQIVSVVLTFFNAVLLCLAIVLNLTCYSLLALVEVVLGGGASL